MKNENNIEKIFQDGFENYQPEVNPDIWNAIESNIQSGGNATPPSDGGSTSFVQSLVKSTQFWVATTIITVGVVSTIALLNNGDGNDTSTPNTAENNTSQDIQHNKVTPQQGSQEEPGDLDQPVVQDTDNNTSEGSNTSGSTSPVENDEGADDLNEETTVKSNDVDAEASLKTTEEKTSHQEPTSQKSEKTTSTEKTENTDQEKRVDFNRSIVSSSDNYFSGSEAKFQLDNNLEVESIRWYLNGKLISSGSTADIQFEDEGRQLVEAEVLFTNGKEKIYDLTASVKACSYLGQFEAGSTKSGLGKLPNTFSPNSDGKNDYFSVDSKNIASFNIMIFDAKGQMVFGSEKADFKWDGNDKYGKPLVENEFRFSLRAVGKDGQRYQTEGQLIIYR